MLLRALPQVGIALYRPGNGVLQGDQRLITHVLLGPGAVVVVVGASQGHAHGGEGGLDADQGAQEEGEQAEQQGDAVHQQVGEVVARRGVAQTHQHLRHEVPEAHRLVIGDVIGLDLNKYKNKRFNATVL